MSNRAARRAGANGHPAPAPPPQDIPPGAVPVDSLPAEVVDALRSEPDPYALFGRAQARVAQLERVIGTMLTYLQELKAKADAEEAALIERAEREAQIEGEHPKA